MTAQYALKCLIPESNPRALPLWMSTLPEIGCKDNKKSRLCKRTTAYILYLVRCICLSHRLFPKLRPSEDSLFCCFWSGRRGSNSRPQPWQGCALPTELLPHVFRIGAQRYELIFELQYLEAYFLKSFVKTR